MPSFVRRLHAARGFRPAGRPSPASCGRAALGQQSRCGALVSRCRSSSQLLGSYEIENSKNELIRYY